MSPELLIDQIYEAGVAPGKWLSVLEALAKIADAEGAMLFAASPGTPRIIASPAIESLIQAWTASHWFLENPRGQRLVPMSQPRFLTDHDALTDKEMNSSGYYTEFLRPRGYGWCVGTSIRSPAGDTLIFSLERAYRKGPVPKKLTTKLDAIRPHLGRAALLSGRIGLERVRASIAMLDLIGLPAAALGQNGKVIATNDRLLGLQPSVMVSAYDQILFSNRRAQALLIEAVGAQGSSVRGRSIPVAGTPHAPPFVAHVLPLRGDGLDIFSGAQAVLYITSVVPKSSPESEVLQALFDLTPSEARVANLIVSGLTVAEIALTTENSQNTIRQHLKSIFSKTGAQRQAELVSMLGMSSPAND